MEHLKLESVTDSPDFWNDSFAISSYCNSILQATKKEKEQVSISINEYNTTPRVSYEKRYEINKYCIHLPKLKDFYIDEQIQTEDIKLRKAFLKHELSHIIFSEMENYLEHHKESTGDIRFLANAIEDVRIENFFGKRFPGANDTFFDVQSKFYRKGRKIIETETPSIKNLSLYFLYRSKKFEFENTLPVQIYDKIFQNNQNFLNLSQQEIFKLLEKIKSEFEVEINSSKEDIENYEDELPEKQVNQSNPNDLNNYNDIYDDSEIDPNSVTEVQNNSPQTAPAPQKNESEETEEPENSSDSSESSQEESDSTEDQESDSSDSSSGESNSEDQEGSQEDSNEEEDLDEDFDEDQDEDEDEDGSSPSSGNGSSNDYDNSEGSLSSSDFSDMIREQLKNNLEKEDKNIDDFNSDNKTEDQDLDSLKEDNYDGLQEEKVLNVLKLIDYVPDNYFNLINSNSDFLNDFLKYNNSKMKNNGSKIIDLSRYISLISKNKKQVKRSKKNVNQNNTRSLYSIIASKNNKNIISLINFFKLKFQDREKSKRFFNKEFGDLNNESLYKLFNHEDDNKIFSNLQKSLVTKQDVSFLLDFSGSMDGYKLKALLESLVILNEVFSKIEINYNVFSFTGRTQFYSFQYNSLSEKTLLLQAFSKHFKSNESENKIDFVPMNQELRNITPCLINRNSKPEERKKIINFLLNMVYGGKSQLWGQISGGGTPEVQSMIALYNNLPKQKLFLINDGEYDKIDFFGKEINKIDSIKSLNIKEIDFYKIGLNLLSGKPIEIRNMQEKNLFLRMLREINDVFHNRFNAKIIGNFFDQNTNFSTVNSIIEDYRNILRDISWNSSFFDNKDITLSSNQGFFKLEKTYNPRGDVSTIKIETKVLPRFSLKVTSKIIDFIGKRKWGDTIEEKHRLFLDKDEVTDFLDVYKLLCFSNPFDLTNTIERNDITQYTYVDLINKMKNSGWSIFGIGIENDYGKNYIGDQNFTYVKNYGDIRQNLEKKVKKIVN
jgi:hypothetical protein